MTKFAIQRLRKGEIESDLLFADATKRKHDRKNKILFQGPFLHEAGGKFANGIITKTYSKGEVGCLFASFYDML